MIAFTSKNGSVVTNAIVNSIIESIKYQNSSADPPSSVNLVYSFNNGIGAGNSTITSTIQLNIAQVNVLVA